MSFRESNPLTSLTLLRRIGSRDPADAEAWPEFHRKYRRLLSRWCIDWGASREDADDIVQESLLSVFRHVKKFERRQSGSFRCWIKLIALRTWRMQLRKDGRTLPRNRLRDVKNSQLFGQTPADVREMLCMLDRIADAEIMELALSQVRDRVSADVWEIFECSEFLNIPIAEIAETRGISQTAVRVSNFRVRKLLKEYVQRLESQ